MRQQSFFAELAEEGSALLLGGDGRADSPGHSAKYGSYSLVDLNHKVVLDIQLVQVRLMQIPVHCFECLFTNL